MNIMFNWLATIWNEFSMWVSSQPTFVQVAVGVALFYLVLHILRALYKFTSFLLSGLFAGLRQLREQKHIKSLKREPARDSTDDEKPPFVFR